MLIVMNVLSDTAGIMLTLIGPSGVGALGEKSLLPLLQILPEFCNTGW